MGIAGLHGLLKSIQKPCSIKKFEGQTLGIDAYGWLHRGTIACAIDLALERHTAKYVDFAMHRVRMLLHYGVIPYLVFDGGRLPSKDATEDARAARRTESKRLGLELYRTGRLSQAQQELQKAIDVTPYMARLLIEELKKSHVQYIVAPYEADAQLVYLEKEGIINGIISEDSDMLVFGARILISKLDKHGNCIEVNRNNFSACRDVSFIGWTDENFRQMCILSGCDYLPSIPKLGLRTAYRNLRKYKTVERVVKFLQFEGQTRVPSDYLESFRRAELTFLHQRVFCPKARKLTTLNPLPNDIQEDLSFLGKDIEPDIAIGIACGDLDPITTEPIHMKSSYPERRRTVRVRRQTLPLSDEKKQDRPISAFFTPKRIPLGELDPNSLTPSPSQQVLLAESSRRSWAGRPAPTPPSVASSFSVFRTSPDTSTVNRELFLSRAGTLARPLPAKRQRLCSDAADTQPGSPTGEHSRFFLNNATASRNGQPQKARLKKPRKADFGVFSDDSVEGIMCQLHDSMQSTAPMAAETQTGTQTVTSSCDGISDGPPCRDISEGQLVTSSSITNSLCGNTVVPLEPDQDSGKKSSLNIGAKFAFVGKVGSTKHVIADEVETLRTKESTRQDVARDRMLTYGQLKKPGHLTRMTPLQRLQQTALGRSKSMNFLKTETANDGKSELGYVSDHSASRPTISSFTVPPSLQAAGSEDLIIPNTDDSDDGSVSNSEKHQRLGLLDLKRFEFSSK
ncbi:Rad2 nuclease [Emydomyces testavorans]|uniref:Rad2 nuclease n=1 Tax=Emydomyces testavorans TaxID=2070801 RepID=A0AAF0IMS3_9EURO|nr:Rad2 nuclease [Emydomyces testavorans]